MLDKDLSLELGDMRDKDPIDTGKETVNRAQGDSPSLLKEDWKKDWNLATIRTVVTNTMKIRVIITLERRTARVIKDQGLILM